MGLKLKVGVATDKGLVRERNEDAAAVDGWVLQHDTGAPTELVLDGSGAHRLAVCDGMGGHLGGATASLMAAQELTRIDGPEVPDHINQVSARLVAAGHEDPALFGMAPPQCCWKPPPTAGVRCSTSGIPGPIWPIRN